MMHLRDWGGMEVEEGQRGVGREDRGKMDRGGGRHREVVKRGREGGRGKEEGEMH